MGVFFIYLIAILLVISLFKLVQIVPEADTYVIEQLGKYNKTLGSGFHFVIPFIQKVAYKVEMREQVIDVDPQVCITSDNVQVTVDGILYLRVVDPVKASYGIDNYQFATAQLAKTTMRSEIGKMDLDNSFSERDEINNAIVRAIDDASEAWGLKVTRYEIKDITPTQTIEKAMEQQMRAEREKRAEILASEGERSSRINISKGERQYAINLSEGERQRKINESEGRAQSVEIISQATADGLRLIAEALKKPKGKSAMSLRLAEQYINQYGRLIDQADTSILPHDLAQLKSVLEAAGPLFSGQDTPAGQNTAPGQNTPAGQPGKPGTPAGTRIAATPNTQGGPA